MRDDLKGLIKVWVVILAFFALLGLWAGGLEIALYTVLAWGAIAFFNVLIAWRWDDQGGDRCHFQGR